MKNKELGQYWTPDPIAQKMISLIENGKNTLDPCSGMGAFSSKIKCTSNELDEQYDADLHLDFLTIGGKYDTIIGNPPYIRWRSILIEIKENCELHANLYVNFIWHAIDVLDDGGEIIFITPFDFLKNTTARRLNCRLMEEGSFTYWEEYADEKVFEDADVNVAIWRWQKGLFSNPLGFSIEDGLISKEESNGILLSDLFDVKVGAASGANKIFYSNGGNVNMVHGSNFDVSLVHYYDIIAEVPREFYAFKNELMQRKVSKITEENWFKWGRKCPAKDGLRIYVPTKTRNAEPFIVSDIEYFDGTLLALFPKSGIEDDIEEWCEVLNNQDWEPSGFKQGGRLIFGQRSLNNYKIVLE